MVMAQAWKSSPLSKSFMTWKPPKLVSPSWMIPQAAMMPTILAHSGLRPSTHRTPYTQAKTARILTTDSSSEAISMVAPYAFSPAGSPKMPVGRTRSTRIRIEKATASRIGVEM